MTSPQAATTEATTTMATTASIDAAINPPNLEPEQLTADTELASHANANATLEQEVILETMPPEEKDEIKDTREDAGAHQMNQDPIPADAAIPDMMHDGHIDLALHGQAHQAGLDALMALTMGGIYDFDMNGFPSVTSHGLPVLPMAIDGSLAPEPYLDESPYITERDDDYNRIKAYAKLEFEDGEFYMNTYSVILGRDLAAARAAMRRDAEETNRTLKEMAGPKTPVRIKREESRYSKSIISESGGILREGDDSDSDTRARRRQMRKMSKKSRSTGSSNHISGKNSLAQPNPNGRVVYEAQSQARISAPRRDGAVPVDPATLRPDPNECPLIGIHPPAIVPSSAYKAISRKHVKIAYNTKKCLFEAEMVGKNGAFVDDLFYDSQSKVELRSGSRLQIGGVVVRFVLPDVAIGETGAEQRPEYEDNLISDRYSHGGKEMSFDFDEEQPRNGAILESTSEDAPSDDEERGDDQDPDEDGEEEDAEGLEEDDEEELEEDEEEESETHDQSGVLQGGEEIEDGNEPMQVSANANSPLEKKRKGPGRPPKNGIMSKREEKEAKKRALEEQQQKAQKTVPGSTSTPAPGKNKVGRPRKHPRPDTPPIQKEKRKYTKRKPKEPKDGEVKAEGSGGEEAAKEEKEKKPPRPPRSPSPEFNIKELTEEQLTKPQANYVTLIYEALSNSESGHMSLPQIYRAIIRRYPYFKVRTTTNGWQSSVRHNLSQHMAFKKVNRDGKGWTWGIVEGASIEKEKKQRRTPPPPQLPPGQHYHQPIFQAGHPTHMMPGHNPYGHPSMMGPPPGYPMNPQMPPNMHPGQPPHYMGPPPQMNGHPPPPNSQPPMRAPMVQGLPAAIAPVLALPGNTTYSSPYAPKQNPAPPPQPNEQRPANEQQPSTARDSPPQGPSPQSHAPQNYAPQTYAPQNHAPQSHAPQSHAPQSHAPPNHAPPNHVPQNHPPQNHPPPAPPPQATPTQNAHHHPSPAPQQHPPRLPPTAAAGPPQPSLAVLHAINVFKAGLVKGLEKKYDNAEEIFTSLVNRVLGYPNPTPVASVPETEPIMKALRGFLVKIPDLNLPPLDTSQPQPQTGQNQSDTQPVAKSTSQEKSTPTVMRPTFTSQRTGPSGLSRPPMGTPVMKRTNSGSSAQAVTAPRQTMSPAPVPAQTQPPTTNGAIGTSTPTLIQLPVAENQLAGQKRERPMDVDDADDMRGFKRLSTSGPPQLKI